MFSLMPSTLLTFLFALPALSSASPSPSIVSTDWEMSLVPRHQLFLRQLNDLQTFTQALGGIRASAITNSGNAERPFSVDGDTFNDFATAAQRSCDNQFQGCQAAANGNGGGGGGQVQTQSTGSGNGGQQSKQNDDDNDNNEGNGNGNNNNNNNNNNGRNGNGNNNSNNNNDNGGNGNGNNNSNDNGGNNRNTGNNSNGNNDGNNGNRNGSGNGNGTNNDNKNGQNRQSEPFANDTDSVGKRQNAGLTVNQCDQQRDQCKSAQNAATVKDFNGAALSINIGPDPNFPDFDLICDA